MGKGKNARKDDKNVIIKSKPLKALIWVGVILFLFVLVVGLLHTAGVLQRNITAITVGDTKLSALEYNIFYVDARSSFINSNYSLLSAMGYPTDSRLDSMSIGDGMTWGDTFKESAIAQAQEVLTLCQEAEAAGFAMNDEVRQQVADYMAGFDDIPSSTGYTMNAYLKLAFGNSTKLSDIEKVYEKIFYATAFQQHKYDTEYVVSDQDIEDYYQENKANYDIATYYNYAFPYTTYTYTAPAEGEELPEGQPASEEEADQMTEASKAEAQAHADTLLAQVTDDGLFDMRAAEYFYEIHENDENYDELVYDSAMVIGGALTGTDEVTEWVKDEARQAGDKTTIDTGSSINVVLFSSRSRNEIKAASVRHILIKYEDMIEITEDMTEEEVAEAEAANEAAALANAEKQQKAEEVYAEWQAGDMTEESFAALAEQYSDDEGSNTAGGLYENFQEGEMVAEFNDWAFDEARQEGDHAIVETEFGYHIMYMVEPGSTVYVRNIRTTLQNEMYTAYIEEAQEKYPMSTSALGLKICF